MTRLLIYSQDGLGLGHLRRARNIAREVIDREPGCAVLVVADSPATPFFSSLPGVDYLKLPTILKRDRSVWRAGSLPFQTNEVVTLRARLMLSIMEEFSPDVVLVDHMPLGALGELKPLLDAAARRKSRPRFVLGLRDILDSPDVIHQVWTELGAYEYLQLYDEVLIYGCRELYDAERAYALSTHARKIRYCGYVATKGDGVEFPRAADEPLVLVTGGGGGDAFPLVRAFLKAFPRLSRTFNLRALILTGPNMPAAEREMLIGEAAAYPIEVRCEDATPWLPQASAVLTMAGYNSLCEVLRWQKKTLVVPRAGPSAEQRIRAELFAERRLIRVIEPAQLGHEILARELTGLMSDDIPDPATIPPLDGAEEAAGAILDMTAVSPQTSHAGNRAVPARRQQVMVIPGAPASPSPRGQIAG